MSIKWPGNIICLVDKCVDKITWCHFIFCWWNVVSMKLLGIASYLVDQMLCQWNELGLLYILSTKCCFDEMTKHRLIFIHQNYCVEWNNPTILYTLLTNCCVNEITWHCFLPCQQKLMLMKWPGIALHLVNKN